MTKGGGDRGNWGMESWEYGRDEYEGREGKGLGQEETGNGRQGD